MAAPYALAFEAFELSVGGARSQLASGVRQYSAADIRVEKWTGYNGATYWNKSLALSSGFLVGALIDATPDVVSWALFVDREPGRQGFSFEAFAEQGGVFTHPDLGGQLKVSFLARPSPDHLESIEFLTDVTLRYIASETNHLVDDSTHELVVRQGSVLCFQV